MSATVCAHSIKHVLEITPPSKKRFTFVDNPSEIVVDNPVELKTTKEKRLARDRRIAEYEDPTNKKIVEKPTHNGSILMATSDKLMVSALLCVVCIKEFRQNLCEEWVAPIESIVPKLTTPKKDVTMILSKYAPQLANIDISYLANVVDSAAGLLAGHSKGRNKTDASVLIISVLSLSHPYNVQNIRDTTPIQKLLELSLEMSLTYVYLRMLIKTKMEDLFECVTSPVQSLDRCDSSEESNYRDVELEDCGDYRDVELVDDYNDCGDYRDVELVAIYNDCGDVSDSDYRDVELVQLSEYDSYADVTIVDESQEPSRPLSRACTSRCEGCSDCTPEVEPEEPYPYGEDEEIEGG